jgi:hypothetical protein
MVRSKYSRISHPIYERCSEIEQNRFWKQFFLDLSHGKVPRSLFIMPNGNILKYKKSVELVSILDDSGAPKPAHVLASDVKDALKCVGIGPYKENKLEQRKAIAYDRWNSIRKKFVKDFYILLFASNLQGSIVERQMAYQRICRALTLGIITNQDIEFRHGEIENINIKDLDFLLESTDISLRGEIEDKLEKCFRKNSPSIPKGFYLMENFWKSR